MQFSRYQLYLNEAVNKKTNKKYQTRAGEVHVVVTLGERGC